mmetsp:Transcript_26067/g.43479  ORF Transcript_26067/g.43479 Transcript_26067/m.43479 type:complete len:340 (-) Transcript_26067:266-1285(-)
MILYQHTTRADCSTCPATIRGVCSIFIIVVAALCCNHALIFLSSNTGETATSSSNTKVNSSVALMENVKVDNAVTATAPLFQRGGIIIFFHVPKSGGTSVQENLRKLPGINYNLITGYRKWNRIQPQMEKLCSSLPKDTTTRVVEIHAGTAPTFLSLQKSLASWRKTAADNHVPYFAFTILREPVAWAISVYNHCHAPGHAGHAGKGYVARPLTDEAFTERAMHNPQCNFLTRGFEYGKANRTQPTIEECTGVQEGLLKNLDWVGITERFNETSVLLLDLLGQTNYTFTKSENNAHRANGTLTRKMLKEETIDYHVQISTMDYALYEVAKNWSLRAPDV